MSPFFHASDEQHVERLRRSMASFDRWRRPLLAFYALIAVIFLGVLVGTFILLNDLGRNMGMGGWGPGFVIGLVMGASLGFSALKIMYMFINILLGFRNERLLITYYDAFREMSEAEEAEDGP
jgi:hypothetical protein